MKTLSFTGIVGLLFLGIVGVADRQASGALAASATRSTSEQVGNMMGMGPMSAHGTFRGFYDSHLDTYYTTDASNKSQATMLHVNYAPALNSVPKSATSPMYFVEGKVAAGQLAVFGSEPGESDYSPLWYEIIVKWKSGVKPVVLKSDDQTNDMMKKGKLTETVMVHAIINAPIIKVGK